MITQELVYATLDERRRNLERARLELQAEEELQGQAAPPRRGLSLSGLPASFSFVTQRIRRASAS